MSENAKHYFVSYSWSNLMDTSGFGNITMTVIGDSPDIMINKVKKGIEELLAKKYGETPTVVILWWTEITKPQLDEFNEKDN
jgi:hypothetical protein